MNMRSICTAPGCEKIARYACDIPLCRKEICEDHVTPEFASVPLSVTREAYTLCVEHKGEQKP